MINKTIKNIYYKEKYNYLIIVFEMTDESIFKLDNCEFKKLRLFNKNKYKLYNHFNSFFNKKTKVTDVRFGEEMDIFIKLSDYNLITIFRKFDFNLEFSYQELNIQSLKEMDDSTIEYFNESEKINFK